VSKIVAVWGVRRPGRARSKASRARKAVVPSQRIGARCGGRIRLSACEAPRCDMSGGVGPHGDRARNERTWGEFSG
jgi:hypothetical protein